jgi:hypothetical protein
MAKKKNIKKKTPQNITVKLSHDMPFDEAMQRIVRVKPPKIKGK